MFALEIVVQTALADGLMLSVLLGLVIFGSLRVNAEAWLNDYPPDIRAAFGSMSPRARRVQIVTGVLFLGLLLGILALGLWRLHGATGGEPGFVLPFTYTLVMLSVFNLFDLVVVDWLVLVWMAPAWVVLPGTEGMEGYSNYGFHFRAFLVGMAGIVLASTLAGAVMAALPWLAR